MTSKLGIQCSQEENLEELKEYSWIAKKNQPEVTRPHPLATEINNNKDNVITAQKGSRGQIMSSIMLLRKNDMWKRQHVLNMEENTENAEHR